MRFLVVVLFLAVLVLASIDNPMPTDVLILSSDGAGGKFVPAF